MSNIEQIRKDREKKNFILAQIEDFLKNNFCSPELSKRYDWLKEHIEDLECEIDATKTLSLQEIIHHEE